MSRMIRSAALFLLLIPFPASAAVTCDSVLKVLGSSLADALTCFASRRSHHQQPADDTGRQFAARAAGVRLHASLPIAA